MGSVLVTPGGLTGMDDDVNVCIKREAECVTVVRPALGAQGGRDRETERE